MRRRRYDAKRISDGYCRICSKPRINTQYCARHAVMAAARQARYEANRPPRAKYSDAPIDILIESLGAEP